VEFSIELIVAVDVATLDKRRRRVVHLDQLAAFSGVMRYVARRTHIASISAEVSNISMMRSGVVCVTMTPRRGRTSTRPVTASCLRASRTGVRDAPNRSARCCSSNPNPGGSAPEAISSVRTFRMRSERSSRSSPLSDVSLSALTCSKCHPKIARIAR